MKFRHALALANIMIENPRTNNSRWVCLLAGWGNNIILQKVASSNSSGLLILISRHLFRWRVRCWGWGWKSPDWSWTWGYPSTPWWQFWVRSRNGKRCGQWSHKLWCLAQWGLWILLTKWGWEIWFWSSLIQQLAWDIFWQGCEIAVTILSMLHMYLFYLQHVTCKG